MRRSNSLLKMMLVTALLICTLAFCGSALADTICVEFTLYDDGSSVVSSYSQVKGDGYVLNDYMATSAWSFKLDPTGISMDQNAVINAWQAGMCEWNRYLESSLFTLNNTIGTVTLQRDSSGNIAKKTDGENTISFASLGDSRLAVTRAYLSGNRLSDEYPVSKYAIEVDIIFNSDVDWVDVSEGDEGMDLQSIATHELGHTLGLGDVTDSAYSYVTMYGYGIRNDISQRTLADPDKLALSKLYKVNGYDDPMKPTAAPTATPEVTAAPSVNPSEMPTTTAAPTATAAPTTAPATTTATVNTTSGGLNMRSEASTSSAKLTTIPRGATVTVLEKGSTWSRVSYSGYTGYVMNQYLKFSGDATPTTAPTTAPTGAPTSAPTATAAPTSAPSGDKATVNTSSGNLNMRASASTSSAKLTTIPRGATVTVLEKGSTWSRISYSGYTGYVMTQYLKFSGDATPTTAPTQAPVDPTGVKALVNTTSKLNMRSAQSTSSSVVTQIPGGSTIDMISYGSDWSKVQYDGYTGYVASRYITVLG